MEGKKTKISRQVSKVLLGVNRRIGGNDCQSVEEGKYGGGEKICLWRYRVLWHSFVGLEGGGGGGLLDSR